MRVWGRCCYCDAHWSVVHSEFPISGEIPPNVPWQWAEGCALFILHGTSSQQSVAEEHPRSVLCCPACRRQNSQIEFTPVFCGCWVTMLYRALQCTAQFCTQTGQLGIFTNGLLAYCWYYSIFFHWEEKPQSVFLSVSQWGLHAAILLREWKTHVFLLFCMALKVCSKSGLDSPLLLIRSVLIVAHFSSFNFQLPSQEPTSLLLAWTSVSRGRKQVDLQDEKTSWSIVWLESAF